MADVYEKDLAQKTSLTTSDYIRVVGSDNVSYKQLVSDVASKIIATYATNALGGKTQSIKSFADHWGTGVYYTGNIDELYESSVYTYNTSVATGTFPVTTQYGTIITIGGTSTNYGCQIAKANGADNTMYVRYRQAGAWSAWFRTTTTCGTLPTGTDLDTVLDAGVYLISGSNSYTHSPTTYGVFEVVNFSAEITGIMMQRITTLNTIFFRYRSSGTWREWRSVTSTAV